MMGYSDFKDLSTRTAFDKVLHDKVLHVYIAKNPKYDGFHMDLFHWLMKILLLMPLLVLLKVKLYKTKN